MNSFTRTLLMCVVLAGSIVCADTNSISNLGYTLHDKLVFRAVTSWRHGKEGFLKEIHEQVGFQRPAFANGFIHCWTFTMGDPAGIRDNAGQEIVFITPSQLARLYRQAWP